MPGPDAAPDESPLGRLARAPALQVAAFGLAHFAPQDLRDAVHGWPAVAPGQPLVPPAGGAGP